MTRRLDAALDAVGVEVEKEIQAGRITGISISVAERGSILWEAGFGLADVQAKRRATAHTPFSLASVTKPFTTAAVMTLVQAGKVDLDRQIGEYLIKPLPAGEFDTRAITPRLLGGHAAGLPMLFGMTGKATDEVAFVETAREFARLVYPAGERYEYSNIGYCLLAEAASHATGRSFHSILEEEIIEPMGLDNTFYRALEQRIRDAAIGYDDRGVALPVYATATPPSGELYASAHDLSIFASNMMGLPFPGHPLVLGADMLREMFAPVYQGGHDAFTTFGWEGCHIAGERVIVKRGGQPGVTARLTMLPERMISIACVVNRTDKQPIIEKLTSGIASSFVPDWQPAELEPTDAIAISRSSGSYQGAWDGVIGSGGMEHALRLEIGGRKARCEVAGHETEISDMVSYEGDAVSFNCTGVIPGRITCKQALWFKLVERNRRLVGRCIAVVGDGPLVSMLPYFVTLSRS